MELPHLGVSTLTPAASFPLFTWRSCTSDWQRAFLYLQVCKNAQERHAERCISKTQVQIEKKKGKYGIEYSLTSASDGFCARGWMPMLKMEFPHLRFSTLATTASFALFIYFARAFVVVSQLTTTSSAECSLCRPPS